VTLRLVQMWRQKADKANTSVVPLGDSQAMGSRKYVRRRLDPRAGTRQGSLRNKILIWAFVPTAIILVAVALISVYAYQRFTENLVVERDRELTRLSANLLAAELSAYTDPRAEQFLAVFDTGMVVFDADGKVLAAEPAQLEGWGPDWAKRFSFRQMARQMTQSSKPVFSNVVPGGGQGQEAIDVFVPITGRDGELVGGIAGIFRLAPSEDSAFYETIEGLRRGESNCIYLVDGNGLVIYHSLSEYIGADFSDQFAVQWVLDDRQGALRTRDLNGQDIVVSFAPVPNTSWGLITEESWAELTGPSRRYGRFLLVLLALGVLVPTLIVTTGVRRITQPIADLIGAAQEIAGGNFDQRIVASTRDELEELAEQFNLMANQLQASYEDLERRVASRTQELATLNTLAVVVSRSLDLEEILNDALDEALKIIGLTKGQAFLLDAETESLVLIAHRGLSEELVRYTSRLPLGTSTSGLAAKEGRPVARQVADYPQDELRVLVEAEDIRLVVSTPLLAKGKTLGAIDLGSTVSRTIQPEEMSMLAAIGHQIGVAVENAQLYQQAQQLAVIKERNRLARDLHDSVMQALYGVTLYAEAAWRQLSSGDMEVTGDHLREIRTTAQEALREMRLLIFELRPPVLKQEGLIAALRARLESVEERVGMQTQLEVEGDSWLTPEVEEGLYRVAVEALNNTLRHSFAKRVTVRLCQDGQNVKFVVQDDGIGFDPVAIRKRGGGLGLRGMEERVARLGARFTLQSAPGKGTEVRVEVAR
jgi:signal transduction histidine kinase